MEDQFLNEWLESQYQQASKRVQQGQHKHEDLTIIMLKHQTNHITHLETDLRSEIKDMRREMKDLWSEIKDMRREMKELGSAINSQTWKMITALGYFTAIIAMVIKL